MKKLLPVFTLLIALSLLIIACKKNNDTMEEKETSVTLYNCNDVKSGFGIRLCYDSLINDSRCPEGSECIWAGFVMIKVSTVENGNTHRFRMINMAGNHPLVNQLGAVRDTTINGYKIVLTDVLPHPKASGPSPTSNQYKTIFTISH